MDNTLKALLDMQDGPTLVEVISYAVERLQSFEGPSRASKEPRDENHETRDLEDTVHMKRVPSETDPAKVHVVFYDPKGKTENERFRCTCPSNLFRRSMPCKHIVKLGSKVQSGAKVRYRFMREVLDECYRLDKEGPKSGTSSMYAPGTR